MALAFAQFASAATITVEALGDVESGLCGAGQSTSETSVAVPLSVSTSCSFAGGTSFAAASGVFDGSGLSLGAEASAVGQPSSTLVTLGSARFTDTVTPTGGTTGSNGFLDFTFLLDGSATCPIPGQVPGNGSCGSGFLSLANGTFGVFDSIQLVNGTTTNVLELPITFGTPGQFTIFLDAQAGLSGSVSADVTANWLNTASLTQVSVLDSNHTVVPGGSIVSDSGLTYPTAAAVPEPCSLLLVGSGLIAGLRKVRIRSRTRV